MDENHQDKTGRKQIATEEKLWLPPLSPKEQEQLDRLQKRRTKANNEKREVTRKRGNLLARLFKVWATPLSILIAAASLLWSVYQFNAQQQLTQAQTLNQQRQMTLQTYLDDMTKLLLEGKLGSQDVTEKAASARAAVIARAKTLTALRGL